MSAGYENLKDNVQYERVCERLHINEYKQRNDFRSVDLSFP